MTRLARIALPTLVLTALALGVGACGEKKDDLAPESAEKFVLMLDFFPNADHAGIYAAQAKGYFEDVGLDVEIRQPPDPAAPIKQVAAGQVDLAISYEPEVLQARDRDVRIVSIGALVREPLTSIQSLPSADIKTPADLAGKTVGTAGIPYQSAYLQTVLDKARVNPDKVKERNVGFNLASSLLAKKVDATLGGFWNYEGVQLQQEGRDPQIIKIQDAGVPTYNELVFVANADALDREGGRLRAFLGAMSRGTLALERNPDTGIDALLKANKDLDPKLQRESVKVTLPLLLPAKGRPYGYQDPREWDAFVSWMRENRLVKTITTAESALTNDLLPGEGPGK